MTRAVLAAALALRCVTPATEVMLVIDTDLTAGDDVDAVRVVVRREGAGGAPSHDVVYDLRSGRFGFPGTIGVVARDPDDRVPLEVTVSASRGGVERLSARATGTPTAEALARLDVFLARRCLDAGASACGRGTTCGRTGCEPVARDPLPPFTAP